jgi:ribosome-binding factor A
MPRQFSRNQRVADLVQRELALLIQREIKDPQLGMVTVSALNLSPDLVNAKVYITSIGNHVDIQVIIDTLNGMSGHFRHELSKILTLRGVPKLSFVYDASIERGSHLSALIDSLKKS